MYKSPLILTVRAVSTEFAQRLYAPVVWIAGGIAFVLIAVLSWAVTVSAWWWLLLGPVVVATLIAATAAIIAGLVIKLVRPKQTKVQRSKVKSFVDNLQQSSETIRTPKFILLFRLVKDSVFPSEKNLVRELSSNASSLKADLQEIIDSFR